MESGLFEERIGHYKLDVRMLLPDIQSAFDAQRIIKYTSPKVDAFTWDSYHSLEDIYQWISDLALKFPHWVEVHSIGRSFEGRDIYAVFIKKAKSKYNVIIDAGIHGNEWISTAFVTYLIKQLVYAQDTGDNRLNELANKYQWFLIPVVNPDGFDYSIKTDRLWRKNRRPLETGEGVDLNRNFPHSFGKYDASNDPKDDNYCGPEPFSEPESKALSDFILAKRDRLKFYISFHAYGQKIITPYDDRVQHSFSQKKYFNYTLYRAQPVNNKQLKFFKELSSVYDVNFWKEPGQVNKTVEFVISPEGRSQLTKDAERLGVHLIRIMEDIQKAFDQQTVKSYVRRNMEEFDWRSYFKGADIHRWLNDLANEYPQEVYLESIGKSHNNRDIIAVRILLGGSAERPRVVIEGGIHAREWISPAFVTYMIHQILKAPSSENKALKEIAVAYEWYFVPLLNPDGYEITHNTDRLWRKNSRGVDLNRNFDVAFGKVGVSFHKWSETYCGEAAFSERESLAMATFVQSKKDGLAYYFAFHSYGQYMIIPYTHSKEHAENYNEVYSMCKKASLRISEKYGTSYTYGTAYDTVGYLTSGVSGCWVKKELHVPYVITFELRDEGHYGFALPPKDILPTCEETMDGVLFLLARNNTAVKPKYISKSGPASTIFSGFITLCNFVLFLLVRYG
ncbi:unnamed protein product, partial [Iphiclides podalirius]